MIKRYLTYKESLNKFSKWLLNLAENILLFCIGFLIIALLFRDWNESPDYFKKLLVRAVFIGFFMTIFSNWNLTKSLFKK